jgi:regulator of RNase E activity RraA
MGRAVLVRCDGLGAPGWCATGLVRDAVQIEELGFPVVRPGLLAARHAGPGGGHLYGDTALCGGVRVARGDLIVADADGVVAVPSAAIDDVATAVAEKRKLEDGARADLLNGMSIREVWDKYQVF